MRKDGIAHESSFIIENVIICLLPRWPCWILTNCKSSPKIPAGQLSQISSVISWEPKTIKKPCTNHDCKVVTLASGLCWHTRCLSPVCTTALPVPARSLLNAPAGTLDVSHQCVQLVRARGRLDTPAESLFRHKPKYHRGRAPALDQWVFGLCDTSTTPGVSYMELLPDRLAQTLIPIIEHRGSAWFDYPQRSVGCIPATQRQRQLHVCHCQPQRELC